MSPLRRTVKDSNPELPLDAPGFSATPGQAPRAHATGENARAQSPEDWPEIPASGDEPDSHPVSQPAKLCSFT